MDLLGCGYCAHWCIDWWRLNRQSNARYTFALHHWHWIESSARSPNRWITRSLWLYDNDNLSQHWHLHSCASWVTDGLWISCQRTAWPSDWLFDSCVPPHQLPVSRYHLLLDARLSHWHMYCRRRIEFGFWFVLCKVALTICMSIDWQMLPTLARSMTLHVGHD